MSASACRGPGYAPDLRIYLRDIDATERLSREEECELAGRVADGDPTARDRLIRANLRLVVHLARAYLGRGLGLDDLIAEGNLGLMRAVEGYDAGSGVRFSTYAGFWIKQSLRRGAINRGGAIRLPMHAATLLSRWRRAASALAGRLGRAPTAEEVGRVLRLSDAKLARAVRLLEIGRVCTLSAGRDEDGDAPLADLADDRSEDAEELLIAAEDLGRLLAVLGRLEGRGATVLRMRFGLEPYAPMSLAEAGEVLGLTGARVRQIEKGAICRLVAEMDGSKRGDIAGGGVAR
jgi:RNA polymerase primary sigma factor